MRQRNKQIVGLVCSIAIIAGIIGSYLYRRSVETLPDSLMAAARDGDTPRVLSLIRKVDPNVRRADRSGSVLDAAARQGHSDTVQALLNAGARLDNNSLYAATAGGSVEIVEKFLACGANANPTVRPRVDNLGYCGTPLESATILQNPEMIRILLKQGADPNCRDSHGSTVFAGAVFNAGLDTVRALVEGGAEVNQRTGDGITPLIAVAYHGDPEIARLLLEHGADPKAKDTRGKTAEQIATERNHPKVAALLHDWRSKP